MKIKLVMAIMLGALAIGCSQGNSGIKNGNSPADKAGETVSGTPAIDFISKTHDFGKLQQQENVLHTFRFINSGDAELLITNVKASCGCTVPEYTKNPIAPGDTGKIEVLFRTGRFVGNQFKSLKVYSNAASGAQKLEFSAYIQPPELQSNR